MDALKPFNSKIGNIYSYKFLYNIRRAGPMSAFLSQIEKSFFLQPGILQNLTFLFFFIFSFWMPHQWVPYTKLLTELAALWQA